MLAASAHRSRWASRRVDGLPACSDGACYRAMDWLHQVQDSVERKMFDQVATLLNLEVDLLFFDTTCAKATTTTSSVNACARARPRPPCPAKAATRTSPRS
ncbi:hypothetical protein [Nonomuraea insulae]|uniref:DDE superfamily endonuclease n=1 Tax=Nonomuraea insulae TaxID=1616787 RepID=A0ABW1D6J3_9ACTN